MKIDKKLIKELVNYLEEFNLTELEYQDGDKKIKVSKGSGVVNSHKKINETNANNRSASELDNESGLSVKSPIIGTVYLAAEPGAKNLLKLEIR